MNSITSLPEMIESGLATLLEGNNVGPETPPVEKHHD